MAEPDDQELLQQERDIRARLADEPFDFESAQAIQNIYRAAAAVRRRGERELLGAEGLSWGGFTALWVLWVWGAMETSSLAAECDLTKGTMTGIVTTLEKRELVERTRVAGDRRRVEVALTAAGEEVISRVYPQFNKIEVELVDGLTPAERQALAGLLRRIITNAAD